MRILFFSHLFPNQYEPNSGIFNIQRGVSLKKMGHTVYYIVPISIIPPLKYIFPIPHLSSIVKYYNSFKLICSEYGFTQKDIFGVKWFPLPKRFFWAYQNWALNLTAGKRIKKLLNEINPDLIITSVLHPEGTYSRYFKKNGNFPVIAIAEGSELLVYPKYYSKISKIIETINQYCDMIVLVSGNMAEVAGENNKFKNMRVIKNGYDRDTFRYIERNGNGTNMVHVLSVGNLETVKGHDVLLEAVKMLPDVRLTIAGDGECYNAYKQYIAENKLTGRVDLKGYVKQQELVKLFETVDLFCLPSRSEGFGIAAVEAMACGVPVIANATGEMKFILRNGVNGFLLDELTPKAIAEKITLSSGINWDRKAIASSVGDYGWDKWGFEMNNIFNELINKKSKEKMSVNG